MYCRVCKTCSNFFYKEDYRTFYLCPQCSLIFTMDFPNKTFQEKHYKSQWETANSTFWKDQVNGLLSIIEKCNVSGRILDFGSGSGETVNELLRRGKDVTPVDPLTTGYLKDQNYPHKFNIVIAIEVIEHLHNLLEEINEISNVLTEDGIVICTTQLTNFFIDTENAQTQFTNWWYKNDQTHVNFFCNKTIIKLAELGSYSSVDIYENKAFVLKKQHPPG